MARPKRKADHVDSAVRDRIQGAALSLFVERGYSATTVREIVAAAGVTKPVLYYYFKSKEGLYLKIMNGIGEVFDQRVSELRVVSGSVRERMIHFFTGMFDGAHENLDTIRLAYSIYFGPPQGAPFIDFNRFFDQTLDLVRELIATGIRTGEILPCDNEALTWTLVGSYQTILEEQICHPMPRIDRTGLLRVINLVLDGVSSTPSERHTSRSHL